MGIVPASAFRFVSSNSCRLLASVLFRMSLAACSLICKYVNFNLGIGKQARNREVNRRHGREEERGEGKECFWVRKRGNDIISDHFYLKYSFRQDFLILLLNLTTIVIKHLHFFVKRFIFERWTWFVLNIFEMNGQFKCDPLVSSLM